MLYGMHTGYLIWRDGKETLLIVYLQTLGLSHTKLYRWLIVEPLDMLCQIHTRQHTHTLCTPFPQPLLTPLRRVHVPPAQVSMHYVGVYVRIRIRKQYVEM